MKFFFLLFCLISGELIAQDFSVRIENIEDINAYSSNNQTDVMEIFSEVASLNSLGNSEEAPIISYMALNGNENQENFFVGINNDNNVTLLPKLDLGQSFYFIDLEFKNFTDRTFFINGAIKKDDNYVSFPLENQTADLEVAASTEVNIRVGLSLTDICSESGSEYSICLGDTTIKETLQVYFSLVEDNQAGTTIETSSDGLFLKLHLSNTIPQNAFSLTRVDTGDERLFLSVTGGENISQMGEDFYKVNVFSFTDTNERSIANPREGTFVLSYEDNEITDNGEYIVNDLENGLSYNLAISKVNKFFFSSSLSNSKVGVPEKVDVFIEKSSCYLLSAGFARDHYVLEFFRDFRDDVLMKSYFGRKFIDFYYLFAPEYTSHIRKSPVISLFIRVTAYIGHFVFKNFTVLIGMLSLLFVSYSIRRRIHGRSQ